jgi:hypothetical protein
LRLLNNLADLADWEIVEADDGRFPDTRDTRPETHKAPPCWTVVWSDQGKTFVRGRDGTLMTVNQARERLENITTFSSEDVALGFIARLGVKGAVRSHWTDGDD